MNRRLIAISTVIVVLIAVIVAVVVSKNAVSQSASVAPKKTDLKVGDKAPPIQVSSTAGYFDSTTIHQPILLEVFATWCPHCQRETAILNKLQLKYGNEIKIISVSGSSYADEQNSPESQAHVVAFAQHFNVIYPVAYDPDLTVAGNYLNGGFPSIVVINKAGYITSLSAGEATPEDLEKRIKAVL